MLCWLITCGALTLNTLTAGAAAWVAREGLTGAQYQSEFEQWSAAPYHLRLVSVAGYAEGGQAKYAALWEKRNDNEAWSAVHGANETDFVTRVDTLRNQGWRPSYFNVFGVGNAAYFNGIFEPTSNDDFVFQPSMTWTEYGNVSSSLTSQGYRLVAICPYNVGAQDYYAALWDKPAGIIIYPPIFRHRETSAQYQATFESLTTQGYRLLSVRGFTLSGEARFTSRWTRAGGSAWWSHHGMSLANYQGATWNAYYQGYRPTQVSVQVVNGVPRFNAIWTFNSDHSPSWVKPVEDAILADMEDKGVPGLSLAISRNGRLVYARGFGLADKADNEWMHPRHRLRIASVSKTLTALGVMKLRDAGTLSSLDKTVFGSGNLLGTQYGTPPYTTKEQAISVRHLLHHTSGWTDNASGDTHAEIIDAQLDNTSQPSVPGASYSYLNNGFLIAGRVIEKLSGKTYEQYIKDAVLAPSGITDMEIGNKTVPKAREVTYYPADVYDPYWIDPHLGDAAGGWIAKPIDLLLLLRRIDGNSAHTDVISGARFTEMHTGSAPKPGYGLGLILGNGWWGHNGAMQGTGAFLVRRNDGIAYAVAWNTDGVIFNEGNTKALDNWLLKGHIDAALNSIPASAWPEHNLFASANVAFDAWVNSQFAASALAQPGLKELIWGPEADPDGDGDLNVAEAYFGHSPLAANADFHGRALLSRYDYIYRWLRPSNPHGVADAVTWSPKVDGSVPWTSSGVSLAPSSGMISPPGSQWTDAMLSRSGRPIAFMRLDLTLP